MRRKQTFPFFLSFIIFTLFSYSISHGETKPVGFAIAFPDLTFNHRLSKSERTYLGITDKQNFSLREIRGSLLLIEFLSTYCINCQKHTPILNDIFTLKWFSC